jgi:hypothetical protein
MVMPQMVLYTKDFYEQHRRDIDDAAEVWGYMRIGDPTVDFNVDAIPAQTMIAFGRVV